MPAIFVFGGMSLQMLSLWAGVFFDHIGNSTDGQKTGEESRKLPDKFWNDGSLAASQGGDSTPGHFLCRLAGAGHDFAAVRNL
jgi:hypothetical protein